MRAPLASSYPTKVALVLLALCPYIVVTTAGTLLEPGLERDLHTGQLGLQLASGLANAGYAFGAVLAVALIKRLPPRPLLLAYESVFVVGSVLAATASGLSVFTLGRVLQGAATGLLLVAALPPLVTAFSAAKLPTTVAVVDIGLFGATTIGPLVGGWAGGHDAWRTVFWVTAVAGVLAIGAVAASVERGEPLDPDGPLDRSAILLAAGATALPFFAASELAGHPVVSWWVLPALVGGLLALATLLVVERVRRDALTPVGLLAHTLPITGVVAAMATGAAAVALLELAETVLVRAQHDAPVHAGELFWPQVAGVAVAALAFSLVFRRRHLRPLIITGSAALAVAAVGVALLHPHSGHLTFLWISALIGFGAGATVSPGLFMAALSLPSNQLGPTFALVELLRSEAAFLVAPILLHVAMAEGRTPSALVSGVQVGGWVVLGIVVAGSGVCALLWRLGGAEDQEPDLERWLAGDAEALDSPPIAATVR